MLFLRGGNDIDLISDRGWDCWRAGPDPLSLPSSMFLQNIRAHCTVLPGFSPQSTNVSHAWICRFILRSLQGGMEWSVATTGVLDTSASATWGSLFPAHLWSSMNKVLRWKKQTLKMFAYRLYQILLKLCADLNRIGITCWQCTSWNSLSGWRRR